MTRMALPTGGDESTRICLISNYRPDAQQSMLRYAEMLESMLTGRGYKVTVLHPPAILGRLPIPQSGLAKWVRYIDKYVIAPWYLQWKCRGTDIVHVCDHSNSMYLRCAGSRPHVVTCHDLLAVLGARGRFPAVRVGRTGRIQQRWIATSLSRAELVICVSHNTAALLQEMAPEMKGRFRVIHHSLNRDYVPSSESEIEKVKARFRLARDAEYLLHVGGNSWYKNRPGVLAIFSELRNYPEFREMKLIMAGKPWTKEMRDFRRAANLEDHIFDAGEVSDQDLQALYSGAKALLFPSLEEGFGWPVLEAQACGCPVVTTNRPPMTEIAGDAAILIEPENPAEAATAIRDQWWRLTELRAAGFRNLERFTETCAADAYSEVYAEAIQEHRLTDPHSTRP